MLSVENVSAGYGKISVLSEISIKLESNSILGVLGRNGMGKSTLIKVLSGVLTCHSGKIFLDNEDITDYPPHLRAQKKIATSVQGRGMFPRLKVVENFDFAGWFDKEDSTAFESEDTMSILNKYIDESDISLDKSVVKKMLDEVYREACEMI